MNAAQAQPSPQALPAPAPAPGRETVVPLYNEQDLALALAPWKNLARQQHWVKARLLATDLSVLVCCFILGRLPLMLRDDQTLYQAMNVWWADFGQLRLTLFAVVATAMIGWMWAVQGHYTASRRKPWWEEARDLFTVIFVAAMADAMIMYLAKWPLSRLWTGTTWALVLVALPLARLSVRTRLLRAGLLTQPYVLVGHPDDVEKAAVALGSEPLMGYKPVAVVSPNPGERLVGLGGDKVAAPSALTPAVRQFLSQPGPYQIVGVMGIRDNSWLRELAKELMHTRDDVVLVPPIGDIPIFGMEISHFFSHDVLLLRTRNNLKRRGPQLLKRLVDIAGSAAALLALSPLFAYVAWRVSRDGGSPFFGHVRVGQHGQPFKCYKFRSMVINAQEKLKELLATDPAAKAEWDRDFKLKNDPRISPIGHFLRKTSLDELPQLWNVLRGEMSLVGPRPLIKDELERYESDVTYYLTAKPGMTGLWQISGRSDTTYESRVRFDAWYVRNWSLWYDFVILLRTVGVVLRQEGAH